MFFGSQLAMIQPHQDHFSILGWSHSHSASRAVRRLLHKVQIGAKVMERDRRLQRSFVSFLLYIHPYVPPP